DLRSAFGEFCTQGDDAFAFLKAEATKVYKMACRKRECDPVYCGNNAVSKVLATRDRPAFPLLRGERFETVVSIILPLQTQTSLQGHLRNYPWKILVNLPAVLGPV